MPSWRRDRRASPVFFGTRNTWIYSIFWTFLVWDQKFGNVLWNLRLKKFRSMDVCSDVLENGRRSDLMNSIQNSKSDGKVLVWVKPLQLPIHNHGNRQGSICNCHSLVTIVQNFGKINPLMYCNSRSISVISQFSNSGKGASDNESQESNSVWPSEVRWSSSDLGEIFTYQMFSRDKNTDFSRLLLR